MRFPTTFKRVKPAAPPAITLGADGDPNTSGPGTTVLQPSANTDNVFVGRFTNASGWPAHRLGVAYKYEGGGVAIALPTTVYLYDAATNRWYTLEAAKSLVADTVVFFDVISLLDGTQAGGQINSPTQGSIEAYVRVTDPGAAPNGDYTFAVGADSSLF